LIEICNERESSATETELVGGVYTTAEKSVIFADEDPLILSVKVSSYSATES
jgi:hypothetical protein